MKKIKLNKRQKILTSFVVLVVVSISVMTLAFFKSTDEVTNNIQATNMGTPKIQLAEPTWDSNLTDTNQPSPTQVVPNVTYAKDPQVTNLSESSVYVRLTIGINSTDLTPKKKKALLESIQYEVVENKSYKYYQFLTVDDNGNITGMNDKSSDFFYYEGYFYYGIASGKDYTLTPLSPSETTSTLFDAIYTPSDTTYTLYFEDTFSIDVTAEAVYVLDYLSNEPFEDIISRFEE